MNKNALIIVLACSLMIAVGWILWMQSTAPKTHFEQSRGLADTRPQGLSTSRLSGIEKNLAKVTEELASLRQLMKDNMATSQAGGISVQTPAAEEIQDVLESELDPFSPEGIAKADREQNDYIDQVDEIFQAEDYSADWASAIEADMLAKLSDMNSFAQQFGGAGRSATGPLITVPDISVSSFNCRSQLCATEVVSGTMQEMLAYQNFMVEQTKLDLPSMVFSTIEPYGNKFKMRAFLARDEYQFPPPKKLQ
ncbi:MAG: hypothetical protein HKN85_05010 [Gammaproteobacteria bacterium]|nr:hypothetical protein [Gammaproteobacteria bacterium]